MIRCVLLCLVKSNVLREQILLTVRKYSNLIMPQLVKVGVIGGIFNSLLFQFSVLLPLIVEPCKKATGLRTDRDFPSAKKVVRWYSVALGLIRREEPF